MLSTPVSVSTSHSTAQPCKMAVKYAQQMVRRVTWAWVQGWVLQSNVIWWQSRAAGRTSMLQITKPTGQSPALVTC